MKIEYDLSSIDDEKLKKAMLNKLKEHAESEKEPVRELERKRVDAKLRAKQTL